MSTTLDWLNIDAFFTTLTPCDKLTTFKTVCAWAPSRLVCLMQGWSR